MALESATYIDDLVDTNPTASDNVSQGDDHIRLLKSTIQASFPAITGAMTSTHTELNILDGATVSTAELNQVADLLAQVPTLETVQATTSGTEFDFTSIPSWVTKIDVLLDQVSLSGSDEVIVQLGDAGGIETTGYLARGGILSTGSQLAETTGYLCFAGGSASNAFEGICSIVNITGNVWVSNSVMSSSAGTPNLEICAGRKALSDTLTQLRVTRNGSNTFDAGQVNIRYT